MVWRALAARMVAAKVRNRLMAPVRCSSRRLGASSWPADRDHEDRPVVCRALVVRVLAAGVELRLLSPLGRQAMVRASQRLPEEW